MPKHNHGISTGLPATTARPATKKQLLSTLVNHERTCAHRLTTHLRATPSRRSIDQTQGAVGEHRAVAAKCVVGECLGNGMPTTRMANVIHLALEGLEQLLDHRDEQRRSEYAVDVAEWCLYQLPITQTHLGARHPTNPSPPFGPRTYAGVVSKASQPLTAGDQLTLPAHRKPARSVAGQTSPDEYCRS